MIENVNYLHYRTPIIYVLHSEFIGKNQRVFHLKFMEMLDVTPFYVRKSWIPRER